MGFMAFGRLQWCLAPALVLHHEELAVLAAAELVMEVAVPAKMYAIHVPRRMPDGKAESPLVDASVVIWDGKERGV